MWAFLRRTTLTQWIIVATILGVVVGYLDNTVWTTVDVGAALKPLSDLHRMIKSIVVPLIMASLVVGIAGTATTSAGRAPGAVFRVLRGWSRPSLKWAWLEVAKPGAGVVRPLRRRGNGSRA
jgi:Na+/H+-dicarboxylate symporter